MCLVLTEPVFEHKIKQEKKGERMPFLLNSFSQNAAK